MIIYNNRSQDGQIYFLLISKKPQKHLFFSFERTLTRQELNLWLIRGVVEVPSLRVFGVRLDVLSGLIRLGCHCSLQGDWLGEEVFDLLEVQGILGLQQPHTSKYHPQCGYLSAVFETSALQLHYQLNNTGLNPLNKYQTALIN